MTSPAMKLGVRLTGSRFRVAVLSVTALVALVALAQFHVRLIATKSIQYDDAHNANVAKNLAMGYGYSTSYHEMVPFNPEATTGPVVLVPAAAFVRVFGNRYWVPTFSGLLCLWAALGVVLLLLRPFLTNGEWLAATTLTGLGLMLYHARELGLLGDAPAALLAVASLLLLCRPRHGRESERSTFPAGLVLGLAIETKLATALVLPSALGYVIFSTWVGQAGSLWRGVTASLRFLAGVLAPIAAWEFWQVASTGFSPQVWVDLKARQLAFVQAWSGAGGVMHAGIGTLWTELTRSGSTLVTHFGALGLTLFPPALALALVAVMRLPATDQWSIARRSASLVLLTAALTHLLWWVLLEHEGWYRHLVPGILYFLVTSAIVTPAAFRWSRVAGAAALALLLLSWTPHFPNFEMVFQSSFRPAARLSALKATRDELVVLRSRHPSAVLVGYGWWVPRDLEYLLPTVGNFKDAQRLQPSDVAGRDIILVRNEFFNWEQSEELSAFQRACDAHVLFRQDPFVVSRCPSLPDRPR